MTAWSLSASFICLKLVLAVSWTYVCRRLAPAFSHGGSVLRGLSPNAQLLFQPQLVSCLLIFHWSKLVTWPSPKSLEEEIIQGHGDKEMYFIGGLTITIYHAQPLIHSLKLLSCWFLSSFYWVDQKVCSGFCKILWKNPNDLFGQPNTNTAGQSFWNASYSVILEVSGSELVIILFSRKHLAIFGGIFGCHNSKCGRLC